MSAKAVTPASRSGAATRTRRARARRRPPRAPMIGTVRRAGRHLGLVSMPDRAAGGQGHTHHYTAFAAVYQRHLQETGFRRRQRRGRRQGGRRHGARRRGSACRGTACADQSGPGRRQPLRTAAQTGGRKARSAAPRKNRDASAPKKIAARQTWRAAMAGALPRHTDAYKRQRRQTKASPRCPRHQFFGVIVASSINSGYE